MKLSNTEKQAIRTVLEIGKQYGYGNLIAWLKHEWAITLRDKYGMSFEKALPATDIAAYPEAVNLDEA